MEAKALADVILPAPHAIFDRGSTDSGHYLYQASSFGPRKSFNAEGAKSTLVELRGEGSQTMIPPSVHPSDSNLAFMSFHEEAPEVQYDDLLKSVNLLAACSEVAKNWGDGHRHNLVLGFSGLWFKDGIETNLIMHIVQRICEITCDHEVNQTGFTGEHKAWKVWYDQRQFRKPVFDRGSRPCGAFGSRE